MGLRGEEETETEPVVRRVGGRCFGRTSPELVGILEAEEGIEPSNDGFANHCLTTWLLRHSHGAGLQ